jgi:hypothetical protein
MSIPPVNNATGVPSKATNCKGASRRRHINALAMPTNAFEKLQLKAGEVALPQWLGGPTCRRIGLIKRRFSGIADDA